MGRVSAALLALAVGLSFACSTTNGEAVAPRDPSPDDEPSASGPNDPWEGMNRDIFWFNEQVDIHCLRPVAVAWDFVMPEIVETAIENVFSNARFPIIFANDVLQAKPIHAAQDLWRFVANSVVGIGGLWDPAKHIGLAGNDEDFGQTLGYWGVPAGPYLVLPFLGPSSPRDTVGMAADSATQPYPYFVVWWISSAARATDLINTRAQYIEEIDENRRTALDYYAFVRNAYVSYRENLVNDREEKPDTSSDELYYFEDDEDE